MIVSSKKVFSAREAIYNLGIPVKGAAVEHLLKDHSLVPSDVLGLAWPESPGLGLAYKGPGLFKPQARPRWWA